MLGFATKLSKSDVTISSIGANLQLGRNSEASRCRRTHRSPGDHERWLTATINDAKELDSRVKEIETRAALGEPVFLPAASVVAGTV
jgi:hypothetical protein